MRRVNGKGPSKPLTKDDKRIERRASQKYKPGSRKMKAYTFGPLTKKKVAARKKG